MPMMDSALLVTPFLFRAGMERRGDWRRIRHGRLEKRSMEHAETSTVETPLLEMQEIAVSVISR